MLIKILRVLTGVLACLGLLAGCATPPGTAIPGANGLRRSADGNRDGVRQPGESEEPQMVLREEWSMPVGNRLQEAVDFNEDGRVDRRELEEALARYREARPRAGKIQDPGSLAARLDLNRDGALRPAELEQIAEFFRLAAEQLERLEARDNAEPGRVVEEVVALREPIDGIFDLNDDGQITREELARIVPAFDQMEKRPHNVGGPLEQRVDLDGNGFITLEEIRQVGNRILQLERDLAAPRSVSEKNVETLLDEFADVNGDGFLDTAEIRIMDANLRAPHQVRTEFDRRIDFNGNGEVEPFEIDKARRAADVPLESDGEERPYEVRTVIDGVFDLNSDGVIDQQEVTETIDFFLRGPRRVDLHFKLAGVMDLNRDSFFSEEERQFALEYFLRPHPANYQVRTDQLSDTNGNRFIEPEEIGVAAGHTSEGMAPSFEGLIEEKLIRYEAAEVRQEAAEVRQEAAEVRETSTPTPAVVVEGNPSTSTPEPASTPVPDNTAGEAVTIFQKTIDLKNKKIAVVELDAGEEIEESYADAIIMFVENAFVNIGTASVVDRQNISHIIDEYQFQASDLSDATTAVQIGKLAGADVIVIGALNYIGKKYYLNIKLIDVSTAEILGSRVETAADDTEFFDTCNMAVSKLF